MKSSFFILLLFSIISCGRQNPESNLIVEKLQLENKHLKNEIDSLNDELKKAKLNNNYWFDNKYDGQDFINKGIENPEEHIEISLQERPELIPLKPILGGKMMFGKIQVLSDKWVIADYSDGHILGSTIYLYKLNKNNKLEFKILDSEKP